MPIQKLAFHLPFFIIPRFLIFQKEVFDKLIFYWRKK